MVMSRPKKRFLLPCGVADFAVNRNTPEMNEPRTNSPREILRLTESGYLDQRNHEIAEPTKKSAKVSLK
jgi:hypothetical protein